MSFKFNFAYTKTKEKAYLLWEKLNRENLYTNIQTFHCNIMVKELIKDPKSIKHD